MKIAYLSYGESAHDLRFLSKMIEYGHEPYLISYFGNKLVNIEGLKTLKFNFNQIYAFNRFSNRIPFGRFTKKIYSFQVACHLKKTFRELKPDLLHTNFIHYEGFCGALSGFHPVLSMPWGTDILVNPQESLFDKFAAKYTLKKADKIVCDCEVMKKVIIKLSGSASNKIDVFPFGIDLNMFKSDSSGKEVKESLSWTNNKILLMNRSFHDIYGIDYFIEALPRIIKEHPETRAILIGDGPNKNRYLSRLDKLDLKDYVYLSGRVKQSEMVKYLNAADIYLTVSLSDGTPVSLLEAFACHLPVIVTDVPAVLEWVDNGVNGIVVPKRDPQSISNAVIKLLDNDSLTLKFADNNLKIAGEKADWDKNYQKLETIYKNLVAVKDK